MIILKNVAVLTLFVSLIVACALNMARLRETILHGV